MKLDVKIRRGDFSLTAQGSTDARVAGLFGPSGSGKTTVLMALAGLITPVRGVIEVGGKTLFDAQRGVNLPPERRRVAVVFQDSRLFPHLSVADNLAFARPPRAYPGPEFHEVVRLLDLAPLLKRHPQQLSGGETKLVAVGRALLSRPHLLLLDEPLAGLDRARARRVLAYLLRLKETLDLRMLYVSHRFSEFLALVDEVAQVEPGRLLPFAPVGTWSPGTGATDGPIRTTLRGEVTEVAGSRAVVESGGARFSLELPGARRGARAYVTLDAEDVILSPQPPPPTSARNVLPGRVVEIKSAPGREWVLVDVGPRLWAEITDTSGRQLGLKPGSPVHVLMKATALRGVCFDPPGGSLPR